MSMVPIVSTDTETRPAGWCYQCGRETGADRHSSRSAEHFIPQPVPFRWVMYGALAAAAEHVGMAVDDFVRATVRELR